MSGQGLSIEEGEVDMAVNALSSFPVLTGDVGASMPHGVGGNGSGPARPHPVPGLSSWWVWPENLLAGTPSFLIWTPHTPTVGQEGEM